MSRAIDHPLLDEDGTARGDTFNSYAKLRRDVAASVRSRPQLLHCPKVFLLPGLRQRKGVLSPKLEKAFRVGFRFACETWQLRKTGTNDHNGHIELRGAMDGHDGSTELIASMMNVSASY